MHWYVYAIVILAYMLVLMGFNIRRSYKVQAARRTSWSRAAP